MKDGFEPLGGLSCILLQNDYFFFSQALIKKEKATDDGYEYKLLLEKDNVLVDAILRMETNVNFLLRQGWKLNGNTNIYNESEDYTITQSVYRKRVISENKDENPQIIGDVSTSVLKFE